MEFKGTKGEMKAEGMIIKCDNIIVGFTSVMNDEHLDERLEGESWLDMRDRTELERKKLNETIPFANAKLFAAAPELLELALLVYNSFGGGNIITFSDNDINQFEETIKKALS